MMRSLRILLLPLLLLLACPVVGAQEAGDADLQRLNLLIEQANKMKERIELEKKAEAALDDPDFQKKKLRELDQKIQTLDSPLGENKPQIQKNIDYVWTVTAGILVMMMQLGFAMLEIGLCRSRNAINVAMKNVLDFSAAALAFLLFGFTFMFGTTEGGWIGSQDFAVWKFSADSPIWTFFFFQVVFVATACTIASGAMAERTKFTGYLCYAVVLSGFLYPVFGHWVWGSFGGGFEEGFGGSPGWLETFGTGFLDFAGSTVVHGIGGASALAGIIVLGPRVGRFDEDGNPRYLPGHNLPLVCFGTLILWVGWFGFNAGSLVEGSAGIGRICVNTAIAGAAGCFIAMIFFWMIRGVPNVLITLNGVLGGLVGITACADVVTPLSAVIIGGVAGIVATAGAILLEKMRLDDVVGAVPVHLFCGIWGTLSVGIFHEEGFTLARLGTQLFGTLAVCIGAFFIALILFKVIDTFIGLRVSDEEQQDGLDFTEHSMNAYADFQTTENH
ncbi:MAG: ammonium transporter [Verrucomicrobiales bacterium]|nr:ammonium transporter [Verrucomicrobiales bacterium]